MKTVELYARVRHAVLIEGISARAAADRFGINARTVSKMLKFSVPPGQGSAEEAAAYIQADLRAAPRRARIYRQDHDRKGLRCRLAPARTREMFVPLVHPRQGMPRPTSVRRPEPR
jgi:hypothetical protein